MYQFPLSVVSALVLTCLLGCQSSTDESTPPDTTCKTPQAHPLKNKQLAYLSYSFDSYIPTAIAHDGRIALHTYHTNPDLEGRFAALVWTKHEWQTWDLMGTKSSGGLGLPAFRVLNYGGQITAFAAATIGSVTGTYVYEENSTRNGFQNPAPIANLQTFSLRDVGGLNSLGLSAAVGTGTLTGSSTTYMLIVEQSSDGSWAASAVKPLSTPSGVSLIPEAVGYHPDGTPWVAYSQDLGAGLRDFKITRRVGSSWLAGTLIATASTLDSARLDSIEVKSTTSEQIVFYWTQITGANASMYVRRYDLNVRTLGTVKTAFTLPHGGCGNCTAGSLAYAPNGIDGVYTARINTLGRAWMGRIDQEIFSAPQEYLPDYTVSGTLRPYYDSCGNAFTTFIGRLSRETGEPLDFTTVPIPSLE